MRGLLADIVRGLAWLLAKIAWAPLAGSRALYHFADWLEGRT